MDKTMQRINNIKENFLSFENLFSAYKKAFKATKSAESYAFAFFAEKEIFALQEKLKNRSYIPADYRYFTIYEPKERQISACGFTDRVVHHALINVLEPIYEKRFIFHSYATRKEKGTHKAILQVQSFLKQNKWYLKMDIQKYFYSIDHTILLNVIKKKIKDTFILELCQKIIAKGGQADDSEKVGLPIGNLTSQFFANVYLDELDHFIKERLRVKAYLRYMDDFCLFANDKGELKTLQKEIAFFLQEKLKLTPKPSATLINSRAHGLPFLGHRIFPALIRYRQENFKRSFLKLKEREWQYKTEQIEYEQYASSVQSLLSHLTFFGHHLLQSRLYPKTRRVGVLR